MRKIIMLLAICVLSTLFGCDNAASNCSSISGYEVVMLETPVNNAVSKQLEIKCPGNKFAMGAGWSVEDSTSAILEGEATHFQLSYDGKSYLVNAKNNSAFSPNWKLRVRCVCANICTNDSSTIAYAR
jgi:hypothetical protein